MSQRKPVNPEKKKVVGAQAAPPVSQRILYVSTTGHSPYSTPRILRRVGLVVQEMDSVDDVLRTVGGTSRETVDALPDLILWETERPERMGPLVCRTLKASPYWEHIPFVYVCAGATTTRHRVNALHHGVDAYLVQPLVPPELVAMVKALLRIKASEAALRRSNAYLDQLFDCASGPIIAWDEFHRVTRVNPIVATLLGRSTADLLGSSVTALFSAEFLQWAQHQDHAHQDPYEYELVPAGEPAHTILWTASTVTATHGNTPMVTIAQGVDVTPRRQRDAQLRIAAIAFECQEGLSVTDAQGVFLQVNRAFCETTGYSASEVIGQRPHLLSAGQHDAAFYRGMWDTVQRTGAWQGEVVNRRKNGESYTEWLTITAVKNPEGEITNYVGTHTDISQRKAAEQVIHTLAFFDPLTGLPNRRLLRDRLERAQASSTRSGREGAVLFIDLDNFKTLNDTHGHDRGDQLLKQVAQRLIQCVREGDTVARQGGDEFVVILEELGSKPTEAATKAEEVGRKILSSLNGEYRLDGYVHHSTASIGATLFSNHAETIEQLLKQADLAMYQVKSMGRSALRFFDPSMQAAVDARSALERGLRAGLQAGQFLLHYQVQVDVNGRLTGVEALLRWQHPTRGLVLPQEFIPLAEETGLIVPLGQWVLEAACTQLAIWAKQPSMAHVTMAVNVSAREFKQPDFVAQVLGIMERTGVNPKNLKLELTESTLMHDIEDVIAKMNALRAYGVHFALDDFGTGYSSLSSLKRLPLDRLKIDQSFVAHILTNRSDAVIVSTIVAMAHSLDIGVIAEGVENQGQRDCLVAAGCFSFQGFFFGSPQREELLRERSV